MELPPLVTEMLVRIVNEGSSGDPAVIRSQRILKKLKNNDPVCMLKRSIYGLRQAGRDWNLRIDTRLREFGLRPTVSDSCVYWHRKNYSFLILLLYVDDFLIASNDTQLLNRLKSDLSKEFKIKDLGLAKYCL